MMHGPFLDSRCLFMTVATLVPVQTRAHTVIAGSSTRCPHEQQKELEEVHIARNNNILINIFVCISEYTTGIESSFKQKHIIYGTLFHDMRILGVLPNVWDQNSTGCKRCVIKCFCQVVAHYIMMYFDSRS